MYTPHKVFAQDTNDPIVLQLNQDLTGLTVRIRSRQLSSGTEVQAAATIVDPPTLCQCWRYWQSNEKPLSGGIFAIEAIVRWPDGREVTHPLNDPLIVQVLPRRTQAGANT